jgi:predicted  nucleic acid-binding Zn-ribbon protein
VEQTDLITQLQDLDLDIMRSRKRLDEMPEKAAILTMRRKIADFEALRGRAQQAQDAVDAQVHRHEDETALLQQKMDAEQAKLMSGEVTNPKEVTNISREMDALRRQKDKLETDTLAVMEKREKAGEQVAKVDAAIEEGRRREAVLVKDFQEKGGALQGEIAKLEAERAAVAAAVEPSLLGRYEQLRESKHGIGLGVLHEDTCSACRVELPSNKVAELKSGEPIGVCPACHRLIVVTPKEHE